jgi:hypothetical protein
MTKAIKRGADFGMGIDHPEYDVSIAEIDPVTREALAVDLR